MIPIIVTILAISAAVLGAWFWRRTRSVTLRIQSWKQRIEDLLPSFRLGAINEAIQWVGEEISRYQANLKKLEDRSGSKDQATWRLLGQRAPAMRFLARALIPLDVAAQFLLAPVWFSDSILMGFAIGLAIACYVGFLTFAVLLSVARPGSPAWNFRLARNVAAAAFALASAGGIVYASARFVGEGFFAYPTLILLAQIAMAEITPIAVAAAEYAAYEAGEIVRTNGKIEQTQRELTALNRFCEDLQILQAELEGTHV